MSWLHAVLDLPCQRFDEVAAWWSRALGRPLGDPREGRGEELHGLQPPDGAAYVHAAEESFWRSLLGERWTPSDSPELAGKWHDDAGSPLQVLLQRLDEPRGVIRAHLDLGTDDLPAEVRRLRALGAGDACPGRGWHAARPG